MRLLKVENNEVILRGRMSGKLSTAYSAPSPKPPSSRGAFAPRTAALRQSSANGSLWAAPPGIFVLSGIMCGMWIHLIQASFLS